MKRKARQFLSPVLVNELKSFLLLTLLRIHERMGRRLYFEPSHAEHSLENNKTKKLSPNKTQRLWV